MIGKHIVGYSEVLETWVSGVVIGKGCFMNCWEIELNKLSLLIPSLKLNTGSTYIFNDAIISVK